MIQGLSSSAGLLQIRTATLEVHIKKGRAKWQEGAWISKSLLGGQLPDDHEHSFRLLIGNLIEINYYSKLLRLGGLSVTAAKIILTNTQSLINII